MRMIFINLPVKDLSRSMAFFKALGFGHNPDYSDETAACIVISESIYAMVLTEPKFQGFIHGEIAAPDVTEVLLCLSCEGKDELLAMKAAALANGGAAWKPDNDLGFMYGASFKDPDGHVWELVHMAGAPPA
jgi:uncharacterized protein